MIVPSRQRGGGEQIKLLDFGIAKLVESQGAPVRTITTALMGTPTFMSPEQCRGAGGVGDKSDVYSLGVLIYLMLSGRPPFTGEGLGEILGKHMYEQPAPLAGLVEGLPPALLSLVDSMLRKDKLQRPSMRQVLQALEAVPVGAESDARPQVIPTKAVPLLESPAPATTLAMSNGQNIVPKKRAPLRLVWLGLGGLGLVGALALGLTRGSAPKPTEATSGASPKGATPPALAQPDARIQIQLGTQPSGAEVVRQSDGRVLGVTPLRIEERASTETLPVRLRLTGYKERTLSLDLTQAARLQETLEPLPSPVPSTSTAAAPPTTTKPASAAEKPRVIEKRPAPPTVVPAPRKPLPREAPKASPAKAATQKPVRTLED